MRSCLFVSNCLSGGCEINSVVANVALLPPPKGADISSAPKNGRKTTYFGDSSVAKNKKRERGSNACMM